MNEDRIAWLRAAGQVSSFRQMYALARHITQSGIATEADRFAAQRVVNALSDIIDKPIAKASRLAKARRRFGALVKSLCRKAGTDTNRGKAELYTKQKQIVTAD